MSESTHELVAAFAGAGLPLHRTLREMLLEHPAHRTERRGCGYTQATRFLSTFVNQPRGADDAQDFGVLEQWPKTNTEQIARQALDAGWAQGWRRLDLCPPAVRDTLRPSELVDALTALPAALERIAAGLALEESQLLMGILRQLLAPLPHTAPSMPGMAVKPEIGSCSQAEEFFLEIAHGRVRRGGSVNLLVDAAGQPLMVEKMGLGESHSALAIAPVAVGTVALPPGALLALRYRDDARPLRANSSGEIHPIGAIAEARFLRLTTLAVPPALRRRAFSAQFEAQLRSDMLSPASTTLDHLRAFALRLLAQPARMQT